MLRLCGGLRTGGGAFLTCSAFSDLFVSFETRSLSLEHRDTGIKLHDEEDAVLPFKHGVPLIPAPVCREGPGKCFHATPPKWTEIWCVFINKIPTYFCSA